MKKIIALFFIVPVLYITSPSSANAQSGVTALMNVVETLQFLKDIKENKGGLETIAKEIKDKYNAGDSTYLVLKSKYSYVKLAADNILNNLVIDLMDKDKRQLFIDRPNFISEYYSEHVQLYNTAVGEFKAAYMRTKSGETGILTFLKNVAGLILGDLIKATRRIAIEVLVEKLKAPYTMKSWNEI